MSDRARILIRALRLEVENRILRAMLGRQIAGGYETTLAIVELREREYLTWVQIGERVGLSAEAARTRYRRAREVGL